MSLIALDSSDFELTIRFKLDNIKQYFPADSSPAGQGLSSRDTGKFGNGWSIKIACTQDDEVKNCNIGLFLQPPPGGDPRPVDFSIRAESSSGTLYSHRGFTRLEVNSEGMGSC